MISSFTIYSKREDSAELIILQELLGVGRVFVNNIPLAPLDWVSGSEQGLEIPPPPRPRMTLLVVPWGVGGGNDIIMLWVRPGKLQKLCIAQDRRTQQGISQVNLSAKPRLRRQTQSPYYLPGQLLYYNPQSTPVNSLRFKAPIPPEVLIYSN